MSNNQTPKDKETELALEAGIVTDFQKEMTYGDYLQLDKVLSSQHCLTNHHDEMLFIIIHQSSELWMKLILHELQSAIASIKQHELEPVFKILSRVSHIQLQLIQSWNVLSTLTPAEYMEFRGQLGNSSGFQSYQNRLIEYALGHKNAQMLSIYKHQPALYEQLQQALHEPSLYDVAIQELAARGFSIDEACINRDWSQTYQPNESVEAAWLKVYQDVHRYWDLYELAEKLVDVENRYQQWRFSHMITVERIIGQKVGTGGSSGVNYLKRTLDHRFFPELWSLRTQL